MAAAQRLRSLFLALLDAGIGPLHVGRVLSLQVDSLTARLIELSIAKRGPAPAAWAWLALGSTARREFTLGSDLENALAYDGSDDRRRRVLRRARRGRDARARALRLRARPERRRREQQALADVGGALGRGLPRVPRVARPLAPDPRERRLRLPPDRRLARGCAAARRRAPRGEGPPRPPAAARAEGHRLQAAARLPRLARERRRARRRPEEGRRDPDREPRALLRALERDHDLEHDRPARRPSRRPAPSTPRPHRRCARRSRS